MAPVPRLTTILGAFLLFTAGIPAQDFHSEVDLVQVECSATKAGRPVFDMALDDFTLFDNGKPQKIEYLWRETDLPVIAGLVADLSGSQSQFIGSHIQAVLQFVHQVIQPRDRALVVAVQGKVTLVSDLTGSVDDLERSIRQLGNVWPVPGTVLADCPSRPRIWPPRSSCSTALWTGIYSTSRSMMKPLRGRKALVVLTDGIDQGSQYSLTDAIEAAQSTDTRVYTIRYPGFAFGGPVIGMINARAAARLNRLAAETGGLSFHASRDLSGVFSQIEEELRTMYVLGFRLPERWHDGKAHNLEVKSKRGGVQVRAKKRYVAWRPTSLTETVEAAA